MAAHPLPQAHDDAPPPRLRAVPPPRGPSRAVIRRRRMVALAALGLLLALPIGLLTTGGGSDREQIADLLSRGSSDPASLCEHLSTGMAQAIGGADACRAASPQRAPAGTVRDVRVAGDTASAQVVRSSGTERVRLVRQDGDWKVDDVR